MNDDKKVIVSISSGTIVKIALFGVLFAALYYLWPLVMVVLTAIVIASFVEGGVMRMSRYHIGRTLAVVIIYLLGLIVVAGIFYLFIPVFISEVSNVITLISKYLPSSSQIINSTNISDANTFFSNITKGGGSLATFAESSRVIISKVSGNFFDVLAGLFGGLLNLVLIIIISFYLSIQEKGIEKFLRIVTPARNELYVIDLWQRTEHKIGLWMRSQVFLGLIVGVLTYIGLLIIGVPNALVLALLSGFFELIPFGLILAIVPAVSFAYLHGGISLALIVLGFYIILQQVENYFIQPLIVKRVIGISPLIVILSLLIGGKLAGFWGIVLAIPVAVAIMEYTGDVEKRKIEALE